MGSPYPETVIGDDFYKEARNGRQIVSMRGQEFSSEIDGDAIAIPGPWFVNEPGCASRGRISGNTLLPQRIGPEKLVAITYGNEREEIRYDVATGIPLNYERSVAGQVVERHVVTSLVLATGQTVR